MKVLDWLWHLVFPRKAEICPRCGEMGLGELQRNVCSYCAYKVGQENWKNWKGERGK